MPHREYFDLNLSQLVRFEPAERQPQQLAPAVVDRIDVIGAFGTCGNIKRPGYHYRRDTLLPVLAQYGLGANDMFNPQVENWSPDRAVLEGIHFARDEVITVAVTNDEDSPTSLLEAGLALQSTFLRGQEGIVHVADDAHAPETVRRARFLFRVILDNVAERYPLFQIAESVETLAHRSAIALVERRREARGNVRIDKSYRVSPFDTPEGLEPAIYLSGTSGTRKPQWMRDVINMLDKGHVPFDDSYREPWDETHIQQELIEKLFQPVQLIAITKDTESLGALAELGPRLTHAKFAGQAVGIYIEHCKESMTSRANRTRTLALEHLTRLREDFPQLPFFIAGTLPDLATYGVAKYREYCLQNESYATNM